MAAKRAGVNPCSYEMPFRSSNSVVAAAAAPAAGGAPGFPEPRPGIWGCSRTEGIPNAEFSKASAVRWCFPPLSKPRVNDVPSSALNSKGGTIIWGCFMLHIHSGLCNLPWEKCNSVILENYDDHTSSPAMHLCK